jgi:hypothetical protein
MIIKFYTIRNYGRDDRYVADKEIAKAFMLITGKKTLSEEVIRGFKLLGAEFQEVVPPQA